MGMQLRTRASQSQDLASSSGSTLEVTAVRRGRKRLPAVAGPEEEDFDNPSDTAPPTVNGDDPQASVNHTSREKVRFGLSGPY